MRKELDLHDTSFEAEAHTLATLQRLKHPNILPLVSCYTNGKKHCLISPFMKDGSLKDFLKRERPPGFSHDEALVSLAGLCSALWALHEFALEESEPIFKGLHQDLNQDNVLVDGHRFILADFGLSSLKSLTSDSRTPFKGRRGYCQAPECAQLAYPYQEYDATRATDIFAMACIITDVLVYLFQGPSGVDQFRSAREFEVAPMCYSLYHKGSRSNEEVSNWLQSLASEDGSQSMKDVVNLVTQMLEITPAKRPKAAMVTARMYTSAIKGFSEALVEVFVRLPTTWPVLVEKSRMLAWVSCQEAELFLSTSQTSRVFETTIEVLRLLKTELGSFDPEDLTQDNRSLSEVRALNTQLLNMLPPDRRLRSRSQLESILFAEVESAGIDITHYVSESFSDNSRIAQMVQTKQLVTCANEGTVQAGPQNFRTVVPKNRVKLSSGPISTAKMRGTDQILLIETIPYHDPITGKKLLPRINTLCTLLSTPSLAIQLRTPPLFALCHDREAFCFDLLYENPRTKRDGSQYMAPVTLHSLLSEGVRSRYPSLGDRIKLALDLAEALAAFHDVNWYHKDLTSSNILFFPVEATNSSFRAQDPYLFGFQHSRGEEDLTQGPLQDKRHHRYHHPNYISITNHQFKGFIRQYDWYSLGVLLFEIGFWAPVDVTMNQHADETNESFAKLLLDHLPTLSFFVGDEYVDVIHFCLTGSGRTVHAGGSGPVLSPQPNVLFKNQVVLRLQALTSRYSSTKRSMKRKASIGEDMEKDHSTRIRRYDTRSRPF